MDGKKHGIGLILGSVIAMMGVAAETEPVAHRLPEVIVRPERNLIL